MNWPTRFPAIPIHAKWQSAAQLAICGLLTACATGYQASGLTGGYTQIPGPGQLDKVFFFGNGYIDSSTVKDYALYRVAEVAQSKNKPHFMIYQTLVGAARDVTASEPENHLLQRRPKLYPASRASLCVKRRLSRAAMLYRTGQAG